MTNAREDSRPPPEPTPSPVTPSPARPPAGESPQAIAERIVARRLQQVRREEVLDTYESLLKAVWDRLTPTLGDITVRVLFDRAMSRTVGPHPVLESASVSPKGLDFAGCAAAMADDAGIDVLRAALRDYVLNLFELLAVLTGDIIVRQLLVEMEVAA